tara:strand:+ start:351 stop:866 length:516 start_codon:yes stop_codon:yes gene_type:complete
MVLISSKLPEDLQIKLEKLTPFAIKYAEYKAKGLKQWEAAEKAGSEAEGKANKGRVGYNTEQQDGVKEYILYLQQERAKASVIDDIEVAEKLRRVYDEAMELGKLTDANKAAQLLGDMIGAFDKSKKEPAPILSKSSTDPKNDIQAFKEEAEGVEKEDRITALTKLIKDTQ